MRPDSPTAHLPHHTPLPDVPDRKGPVRQYRQLQRALEGMDDVSRLADMLRDATPGERRQHPRAAA